MIISIVAVYVDEILLTANNEAELEALKDLGELNNFHGMEVVR